MELPNYSRQLMQQLRALRKESQFCDCSILVGDTPHRAHKLVLAASSLLFRSLLEGSDSISIDTVVVSSQEFSCLLDMVYTGKLPPGKHNFTRIIAAADSLQMFDVAVGCKNILTNLMNQSTTPTHTTQPASPTPPPATTTQPQLQSQEAEHTASPETAVPSMGEDGMKIGPSGAQGKGKVEEAGLESEVTTAATRSEPVNVKEERKEKDGPPSKRARLQLPESTADVDPLSQGGVKMDTEVVDVRQWLRALQTWDGISTEERQVILSCSEGDPGGPAVFQRLQSRVKEQRSLSAQTLLTLMGLLKEFHPNLATQLHEHTQQGEDTSQGATGSEAEEPEEQPQSPTTADADTAEEEEEEEEEEIEVDGEKEGEGERKTRSRAKRSSPSRPYLCRWCSKAFGFKCRMVAHTKRCTMSKEARLQCPECPEELPTSRALQLHRNKAHPESKAAKKKRPKVSCDMCGRTFAHPSGMLYHKRTEHFEEKPFACEECGAKFGANSSLKNHMRLHTGEKPYHCKNCDMSFSVAAALAYHTKKKHSEGKMYSCQYCEALFAQSIELTRHVRTHTGDKPYVCRECGKGFSQANGLSAHLQTSHNISEPHDCQKCRLSFSTLEDHRKHIQECHPKEYHRCPECNKMFTNPALLEKHIAVHAGGKPFSCKLCQKSYQQMSGLWYHNRTNHPEVFAGQTHRQLKSLLQCSVCCKFLHSASSLAKHQKTEHTGMFDSDGLLVGNPDLQSDSSVVKCLYCPGLFPSEAEMQEHASTEHFSQEGAAFGCSLCPLVCPSQLQLQEHFLSCHIGTIEEQEQASTSQMVIETEEDPAGVAGQVISVDQSQQVYVALGDAEDGQSSTEVMAVSMEDLLNGTVTFICGEGQ
ncbi:zinc finger and BTB domain-containing protein 40-like [Salvelinus namaycush]|uniref:Zinc finger and BTB domain-containing protein 40-like n=1 Tax=Salvelinus namaycush TaxID=8040 RepID=A0A8U1F424_SALNM|nr:zinc finger and BTB domain-containing protein 40-like [Salvelinus namaycush]